MSHDGASTATMLHGSQPMDLAFEVPPRDSEAFGELGDDGALKSSELRHLPILSAILLAESDAALAKWA